MRYLVSPDFSKKLTTLDTHALGIIGSFVKFVESTAKENIVSETSPYDIKPLGGEIYVLTEKETRIFFTLGNDADGDYLLLLDFINESRLPTTGRYFSSNDPKSNSLFNPNTNPAINPKWNSSINPKWNSSINPRWNSAINPKWNSAINPKWNSAINTRWNSAINPKWNSSINPKWNSTINPKFNSGFGGPYIYSLKLEQEGFLVRANEQVSLVFDISGNFKGITVEASNDIRVIFDENNNWIGYLVPTQNNTYLRFDLNAEWTGLVV